MIHEDEFNKTLIEIVLETH